MNEDEVKRVLDGYKNGEVSLGAAIDRFRTLPFEDLGFANVDHHRTLRQGYPEVVFGAGKTDHEIVEITKVMLEREHNILVTRTTQSVCDKVRAIDPSFRFYERSGTLSLIRDDTVNGKGPVLVVSAGTSDIPVAEEAVATLDVMGNESSHLYDVGVSGIHRLLDRADRLGAARVIIVVAGMEGALPSVVGGLVGVPVQRTPLRN